MISYEHGRWRSSRTNTEKLNAALEAVRQLTDEERAALGLVLGEFEGTGHSETADEAAEFEWEETPLPIDEWLQSEYHIGETGKDLYPILREDMCELFHAGALKKGGYAEAVLTGAIGWGKDYFATTATMRVLYEVLCLKNPQHTLGLGAGEPIHIVPISRTVAQAKRVVFGGLCKKLNLADWFRGKFVETMEEVRFRDKGVYIVGGASQDASALGLNVICALVDESNFMGEGKVATGSASGEAYDKATMIYNALARRVKSRYERHGVSGLVFLISSKRSTEDFTERHLKQAMKDDDPTVFARDYATWHVHPEPFKDQKWHKVMVSPKSGKSRLLEEDEDVEEDENTIVFEYPDDYHEEFVNDTDGAVRDFGGIATDFAGKLWITRRQAIDEMFDHGRPQWFGTSEWRTDRMLRFNWKLFMGESADKEPCPACCPGAVRHVHIDLSTNQCATGFCMGHVAGSVEVTRRDPETNEQRREDAVVIHIDCILRIVAPDGGDVDHGEVRGLVYKLMKGGVPIRSVSMDQYLAPSNLQMFKRKGLRTEEIGERRFKLKPYITTRQALYEGRVMSPVSENLSNELKSLELHPSGKKVIVPAKGSKDLADALCGVVYYISENMRAGVVLAPSLGVSGSARPSGPQWSSGGNIDWGDDDEYDYAPPPTSDGPGGDGGGFSSWIILG